MIKYIIYTALSILLIMLGWRLSSQRYQLPCPSCLSWMVEMDNPFTKVNRAATIIEHLNLKSGMSVLDIGCGPGRVTIPAAQAVGPNGHVTALDLQQGMLDKVAAKLKKYGLKNTTLVQTAIGNGTSQLSGTYDRILLVTVIGEIPTQQKAFEEIKQLLNKDGILSVTELIFDPHFQRRTTIRNLAKAVGLKEVACYGSWYAYTMHLKR